MQPNLTFVTCPRAAERAGDEGQTWELGMALRHFRATVGRNPLLRGPSTGSRSAVTVRRQPPDRDRLRNDVVRSFNAAYVVELVKGGVLLGRGSDIGSEGLGLAEK